MSYGHSEVGLPDFQAFGLIRFKIVRKPNSSGALHAFNSWAKQVGYSCVSPAPTRAWINAPVRTNLAFNASYSTRKAGSFVHWACESRIRLATTPPLLGARTLDRPTPEPPLNYLDQRLAALQRRQYPRQRRLEPRQQDPAPRITQPDPNHRGTSIAHRSAAGEKGGAEAGC